MDIIQYLVAVVNDLYRQNCWLISFICKYIPLKQWAFDDATSPKYEKFRGFWHMCESPLASL